MKFEFFPYRVHLKRTFTISRGSTDFRDIVYIRFEHDGRVGWGESAPNARYGEDGPSCLKSLEKMSCQLRGRPEFYRQFLAPLQEFEHQSAAKAGLDLAVMDWVGKSYQVPLARLWGTDFHHLNPTSMTISIDEPEKAVEQALDAAKFKVLKLKLGSAYDREMIESIRVVSDQSIRVDANEAWKDREMAIREIEWLASRNVELIEQPMPAAQWEDMCWLKERSPLPLYADEAFTNLREIPDLVDAYHGINIKLQKLGGLLNARDALVFANAFGLKIMLGCMVESSLGIGASIQLAPVADLLDLDGNLWIANDPFIAHPVKEGYIEPLGKPGLGVEPKPEWIVSLAAGA